MHACGRGGGGSTVPEWGMAAGVLHTEGVFKGPPSQEEPRLGCGMQVCCYTKGRSPGFLIVRYFGLFLLFRVPICPAV